MAGYQLRDFTFHPTDTGGLEILVRSRDNEGVTTVKALHMSEAELFEMLAACGLGAEEAEDVTDDYDLSGFGEDEEDEV